MIGHIAAVFTSHCTAVPVQAGSREDGHHRVRGRYRRVGPPLLQLVVHVPKDSADVEQDLGTTSNASISIGRGDFGGLAKQSKAPRTVGT